MENVHQNNILKENEDIKGTVRSLKSKNRQCNGQKKKGQKNKQHLQNITQKTKDRTLLKIGVELLCNRRVSSSAPH
jgi:hypothetical protein